MTHLLRPRWLAGLQYLSYGIAGAILIFTPSLFHEDASPALVVVWHIFLLGGAAVACAGVTRRRPYLEAAGIPLLGAALLGYAVILFASGFLEHPTTGRLGVGFIFLGAAAGLTGRLMEVVSLGRIATRTPRGE